MSYVKEKLRKKKPQPSTDIPQAHAVRFNADGEIQRPPEHRHEQPDQDLDDLERQVREAQLRHGMPLNAPQEGNIPDGHNREVPQNPENQILPVLDMQGNPHVEGLNELFDPAYQGPEGRRNMERIRQLPMEQRMRLFNEQMQRFPNHPMAQQFLNNQGLDLNQPLRNPLQANPPGFLGGLGPNHPNPMGYLPQPPQPFGFPRPNPFGMPRIPPPNPFGMPRIPPPNPFGIMNQPIPRQLMHNRAQIGMPDDDEIEGDDPHQEDGLIHQG